MCRKILGVIVIGVFFFLLFSAAAFADGAFFPKGERDIGEPEQKAVVFYHEGREELILSVRYEGAAEEFAWLVPLPEPPEIEESDIEIFEMMSRFAPSEWPHYGMKDGRTMGMEELAVEIIEQRTVGAFDVTVLRSSDAGELRDWLQERGFAYDQGAEAVLGEYINKDWCFVAMRINPSQGDETESMLSQGIIDPLRLSFTTPQPVYPLHISSLNPGNSEVLIYVLGDVAYHHPKMQLEYADAWQGIQIGVLKEFSDLAEEMEQKGGCVMTKLRATFWPSEMEDLYLTAASPAVLSELSLLLASMGEDNGAYFPVWAIPVIIIILAALVTIVIELVRRGPAGSLLRILMIFVVSGLLFTAVFVPVAVSIGSVKENGGLSQSDWPWEDGIVFVDDGWEKVLYPDGEVEIMGVNDRGDYSGFIYSDYHSVEVNGYRRLDEEGKWLWRDSDQGNWSMLARYLEIKGPEGMELSTFVGVKNQIFDARLSPQGDRVYLAIEPGDPSNCIEVQEYLFPSLQHVQTVMHDYGFYSGMIPGSIVFSIEEEPLLAGYFYEEMKEYIGILPLLEEDTAFYGEVLELDFDAIGHEESEEMMDIMNSYNCIAKDSSPFLLLEGFSYETGESVIYVFNSGDGELFRVREGRPIAWR